MEKVDLIVNADYLITMEGDLEVIENGAVAVRGSDIVDAGAADDISSRFTAEKIIDGKDKVVFPGLINTHTHAPMVYFRGLADDLPLMEWLEKHIWPAESKWLTEEFVDDAVELACLEMLKSGVTTYADQYFYQGIAGTKVEKIGMRGVLGAGVIDFPSKYAQDADGYFSNAERVVEKFKHSELITPCISPHAIYTCGPDNYKRAGEFAEKHDIPFHTHLAETQFEVAECQKRFGKTPVEYFEDIGLLSERLFLAHCVWLTDNEIELLAKRKVGVAHCIESNLKLACGFAPVDKMLKAGVKVAFGTDGAASNNDLSILGEMSTAAKVHKAVSMDPTVLDSKTVMQMATKNGADIIGLGNITGSIKPGKKADLVIANLKAPHLLPMYDVYSHITYSMRPSDIQSVIINGKVIVENGTLTTMNENDILDKAMMWQDRIKE
ncbi:MAG: amidohydrolase family protein [Nitrospira sp.]|nr:amidohydrolase family protein [bacterium]MBL7048084.1 amidohydrolase family protein [Nitrospira sp.]